nr:ligase-associated DNA damage response endonuclease PdeM [Pseudomonas sp.]
MTPAPTPLAHVCAGEKLYLLPERAIWWEAARALIVADVHIGKGAAFRALGQPVPTGTTLASLARLEGLLDRFHARSLVVLGDFLHARAGVTPAVLAALHAWRLRHAGLECVLIRGNHDSHAGDPPASLAFQIRDEPDLVGPFAMQHHPAVHDTHYVLAGHIHPACRLRGRGGDSLRLPCFDFGPRVGVLPAFGEFTGHVTVAPKSGHRQFVTAPGGVWALPPPG